MTTSPGRVPPGLSPELYDHRVGGLDGVPALQAGRVAVETLYHYASETATRAAALKADTTRTPDDITLQLHRLAQSALERPRAIERTMQGIAAAIDAIDRQVSQSMASVLSPLERLEIRTAIGAMSPADRRQLLKECDYDTRCAILTGKSFLSGLSPLEYSALHQETMTQYFGEEMATRARLEQAHEAVSDAWAVYQGFAQSHMSPEAGDIAARRAAADGAAPRPAA